MDSGVIVATATATVPSSNGTRNGTQSSVGRTTGGGGGKFRMRSSKRHHHAHVPYNNNNKLNNKHIKININNNNNNNTSGSERSSNSSNIVCEKEGSFTREVYNAIFGRLGHQTANIPGESVQTLFNDLQLYPSKHQVSEMLQCARQCGRRQNGSSLHLTFGEFCVLVREMQRAEVRPPQHQHRSRRSSSSTTTSPRLNNKCTKNNCEVFLGGSCNPTTWRADTAIPELQKHGITYYNPQVSMWAPELVAQEHDAKQSASVLLYVVDSQTRSVAGMIEVAYLVSVGRCVVLVAYPYRPGQTIMGEAITNREYMDLVNGQTSLLTLVKSQGVKVHNNLAPALQCTANLLRSSGNNGFTPEEQVTHKLRKLRELFDAYDVKKLGEITISDALDAYKRLTNKSLELKALYAYLSASSTSPPSSSAIEQNNHQQGVSFEQFCTLVAEFSVDGCEKYTNDWATRQPVLNNSNNAKNNCNLQQHSPINGFLVESSESENGSYLADVYLGGSCSNKANLWREEIAIPTLKKHGLSYYNPAIREENNDRNEGNVLQWKKVMDKSKTLLFVVTNDSVSLTTMIMAAHYIGVDKDVVLCIQSLPSTEDFQIADEKMSKQAIKDYNRGRVYLMDLAKRKQVPVFENVLEAVNCIVERNQNSR